VRRRLLCATLLAAGAACAPRAVVRSPAAVAGFTTSGLWYERSGQGPVVVLIHGSNLDARIWEDQVRGLTAGFTVVRYDLRFHGKSRDPGGPVSFGRDLGEVMDAAGASRASLVGLSLGGQIAIDFALAHPERVDRLALVSSGLSGWRSGAMPPGMQPMVEALRRGDVDGAARELARSSFMRVSSAGGRDTLAQRIVVENAGLFRADPRRLAPALPAAIDRLSALVGPVLVITGADDPSESSAIADRIVRDVRGARRQVLPACGHLASMDCPASLTTALADFLAARL